MNVLFCGDEHIADGVIIAVLSLIDMAKEPLHIYLLTAGIGDRAPLPQDFAVFLDQQVKAHSPENSVQIFDITDMFNAQPPTANLATRFTPCCMLRLYADLVDDLPDRLLYLDNDVICREDPGAMYRMDLKGAELAGVLDYYGSWFFRRRLWRRDYLNSGVLLLDMAKIRKTGLFRSCRERCRDKKMFMPDQSAINKLAQGKIILPRRYNEQRRLKKDTVFQHFTTSFRFFPWIHTVSVKPWDIRGMHEILKLTEYDRLLQSYQAAKARYEEIIK